MASEEYRDWRLGLSLHQRLQFMFEGQYGCDVIFILGHGEDEESISAHRLVLTCGSSVFERMFERSNCTEKLSISVDDVKPQVFKAMLQFLYCDEVNITAENVISLLVVSKKYQVSQLAEKCAQFVEERICADNVCSVLNQSIQYDETNLTARCLHVIRQNSRLVLLSQHLPTLSHASLIKVIQSDDIGDLTESEIFTLCLKWADEQCRNKQEEINNANRRAALGDVLYEIRFSTMSHSEFSQHTKKPGLLSPNERLYLHDVIGTHDESLDPADYGSAKFNTNSRKSIVLPQLTNAKPSTKTKNYGEICLTRFGSVNTTSSDRWAYTRNQPDVIDFTSNKSAILVGLGLYGGRGTSRHAVHVKMLDVARTVVAETGAVTLVSDGSADPLFIRFLKPVVLSANSRYSIRANILGPVTYYGVQGRSSVTVENTVITFYKTSAYPHNGTDVFIGQIPFLLLSG